MTTTNAAFAAFIGKTAREMRDLLASGQASRADVIGYLSSRDKLRKPSEDLLAELLDTAGKGKAKPAASKPEPVVGGFVDRNGRPLKGAALSKAQAKAQAQAKPAAASPNATGLTETQRLAEIANVAGAMAGLLKRLAELAG